MDIRAIGIFAALLYVGCHSGPTTQDWGVITAFPYTARVKTSWRQNDLLYVIEMPSDSHTLRYAKDSIPSRVLLRFYDPAGFQVMNLDLPLSSTGSLGSVYANGRVECPAVRGKFSCDLESYKSAKRLTALPYSYIDDPMKR